MAALQAQPVQAAQTEALNFRDWLAAQWPLALQALAVVLITLVVAAAGAAVRVAPTAAEPGPACSDIVSAGSPVYVWDGSTGTGTLGTHPGLGLRDELAQLGQERPRRRLVLLERLDALESLHHRACFVHASKLARIV